MSQRATNAVSFHSPATATYRSILVLVIYSLLAVALTFPLITNLTTAVPNDIGDPLLNTWILAWNSHAWLTDPINLFNANIFHPLPNTLAYSEHLVSTAWLILPIQLISGEPVVAYNLSLLISFPLAAFGMYLLALHWTRQPSAAFIAGLIFGFAPYRFAAVAHLQLLTFQWLPFALLFLDKLLRPQPLPPHHRAVLPYQIGLTLFLTLQLLASWYLAIYTLFIFGIYIIVTLITAVQPFGQGISPNSQESHRLPKISRSQRSEASLGAERSHLRMQTPLGSLSKILNLHLLPKLLWPFGITFGLTFIFAIPYLALVDDLRQARSLSQALVLAANITDYIAAASFNTIFGPLTETFRTRSNFTEENTLFLGYTAPTLTLIAIAVALWSSWRQTASQSGPMVITNSSQLATGQITLRLWLSLSLILLVSLALTFPTPYNLLVSLVPPSTIVRVPPRWIIPAIFALAGLAALGYAQLNTRLSKNSNQADNLTSPSSSQIPFYTSRFNPISTLLLIASVSLLLLETLSIPLPLASVENHKSLNPAYHWLSHQSDDFVLLELPLHSAPAPEFPEVKRLYASTFGWWPLINGYSGYTPSRQPQLAQALTNFPSPTSLTTLQTLAPQLTNTPALNSTSSINSTNSTNSINSANSTNSTNSLLYLLIHPGEAPFDRTHWETIGRWQVERHPAFRPLGQFEGDYLYHILPPNPDRFTEPPLAVFGPDQTIQLLATRLDFYPTSSDTTLIPNVADGPNSLTLFWQATTSLSTDYTIFIHLRAADGFIRSQADGPPVNNTYPTSQWQPSEIIQDIHLLLDDNFSQVDHIAVGLYNPITNQRLPAFDSIGQQISDDTVVIAVK